MKGVISKQTNFMRPFSPANFTILTESKLGRPAGTAPIGMGLTAPAGLPSDLRYNHGELTLSDGASGKRHVSSCLCCCCSSRRCRSADRGQRADRRPLCARGGDGSA